MTLLLFHCCWPLSKSNTGLPMTPMQELSWTAPTGSDKSVFFISVISKHLIDFSVFILRTSLVVKEVSSIISIYLCINRNWATGTQRPRYSKVLKSTGIWYLGTFTEMSLRAPVLNQHTMVPWVGILWKETSFPEHALLGSGPLSCCTERVFPALEKIAGLSQSTWVMPML